VRKQTPISQGQSVGSDSRRIARSALAAYIKTEIANSMSKPLAVLMVNLLRSKHFESITRVSAWELALQQIDVRVARILRALDRYARLSEEKLCIVLPGLANGTQAVLAATRIVSALQEPFNAEAKDISVRASVGIAIWPDHGNDADELVRCADMAAHIAAKGGENYHVIRPDDHSDIKMLDGDTERQLLRAIRQNELSVHYQPQIEIGTGRCIGAEALLRWAASGIADVSTDAVISIAEHAGLIAPLTFAVINTVLRDAVNFRREGVDVNLSVNISTEILADLEMPDIVQQAIDTWDVPANSLTFEITESVMIGDVERSLLVLTRLRDMGIRLSIDDFGTGYSSLAYMKRFPVHELKIDKIFVANMLTSLGDRQIVQSVIDLSHNFSLQVVAEGVENGQTFEELKAMGCDIAQGYLFSRALAYGEFVRWLKAWRT
jgi:diguanylate cyclase (GGDEF)-like protein